MIQAGVIVNLVADLKILKRVKVLIRLQKETLLTRGRISLLKLNLRISLRDQTARQT
jgi:hypothetical protein